MNKNEENPFYSSKVQKLLNKLISEETIAHDFYVGAAMAACKCQRESFGNTFIDIADDEFNDHCKHLVEWADVHNYTVPFKYKDYERYASETSVRLLNSLKRDRNADYYIEQATKVELDAIESYKTALELDDVPEDLYALLQSIYFDELQHLETLQTMKYVIDIGAVYVQ